MKREVTKSGISNAFTRPSALQTPATGPLFELWLEPAAPPGKKMPPTMVYLMSEEQAKVLVQLLQQAMAVTDSSPPDPSTPAH